MVKPKDIWNTSISLSDEEIKTMLHDVVSNPTASLKIEITEDKAALFSQDQLIHAFRVGMSKMFKICFPDRKRMPRYDNNPYSRLRVMDKNDVFEFKVSEWGAVRAAATKLKGQFGVVYETHRIKDNITGKDYIQVTRVL